MALEITSYFLSLGITTDIAVDEVLLLQALTHKSFSADAPDDQIPHNERLEFLGDSLLGARVAEELYTAYPDIPESQLTLAKIYLVKEGTLANIARDIDIGSYVRLGNGEERSGGRKKDAILSDSLEALIAYMYLVHGREAVASFIKKYIMSELEDLLSLPGKSWKSRLQEYVQKHTKDIPVYVDTEHEVEVSGNVLSYTSEVFIQGTYISSGIGPSKKKAQEIAAESAMKCLNKNT